MLKMNCLRKTPEAIILVLILLLDCQEKKIQRVDGDREIGATVTVRNFHRENFDKAGVINWKLDADESYVFASQNRTVLYNFNFEQYENGKPHSNMTCEKGILDHSEKSLVLSGNIVLNTSDDRTLKTEELYYNLDEKTLSTDSKVILYSEGTTIYGTGLRADTNLKKFTILRPDAITRGGNPFKPNE